MRVTAANPMAHHMLGVALAKQDHLVAAAEHFAEAVRLDPRHPKLRLSLAQARTRRNLYHQTCFVTVFRRRRAGNNLHRLDRIYRNLIRENLALLVGNRLTIDRERILRMIPETVEESVGVRHDPG